MDGVPSVSDDSRFAPGVIVAAADPAARAGLAAALAADGFAVWPAASGLEALSTFLDHTGEVDAVLLDAALRDLPGPEVARRLHANFPGVPCVFLGDPPEAAALRDRGERAITRPTGPAAVVAAVRGAIEVDTGSVATFGGRT
jgi:DNA-binding response OmpR family regulator